MAEKRTKRRGRRAYLEDFRKNAAGEYIYVGAQYAFAVRKKSRRRFLAEQWLLCGILLCTVVSGGCIPAAGMGNCPYVLLPFAAELMAAISVFWGLCRLTAGGDPLRAYVYRETVGQFPLRTLLTAIFAGMALTGEAVYLTLNGAAGNVWASVLFLVFAAAAAALALLMRHALFRQSWSSETQN